MFRLICSFLGLVTFAEEILNEKLHFLCSGKEHYEALKVYELLLGV